jgi:hypothetical protein
MKRDFQLMRKILLAIEAKLDRARSVFSVRLGKIISVGALLLLVGVSCAKTPEPGLLQPLRTQIAEASPIAAATESPHIAIPVGVVNLAPAYDPEDIRTVDSKTYLIQMSNDGQKFDAATAVSDQNTQGEWLLKINVNPDGKNLQEIVIKGVMEKDDRGNGIIVSQDGKGIYFREADKGINGSWELLADGKRADGQAWSKSEKTWVAPTPEPTVALTAVPTESAEIVALRYIVEADAKSIGLKDVSLTSSSVDEGTVQFFDNGGKLIARVEKMEVNGKEIEIVVYNYDYFIAHLDLNTVKTNKLSDMTYREMPDHREYLRTLIKGMRVIFPNKYGTSLDQVFSNSDSSSKIISLGEGWEKWMVRVGRKDVNSVIPNVVSYENGKSEIVVAWVFRDN